MNIRRAHAADAETLTQIAVAAKRQWQYPESWILAWLDVLTITPEYIAEHPTYLAEVENDIAGFHAVQIDGNEAELDHLWVRPAFMRQGIGGALFRHAEGVARAAGATRLRITSDPHAAPFYSHMGAIPHGQKPAPMDGEIRFLPLFEKAL